MSSTKTVREQRKIPVTLSKAEKLLRGLRPEWEASDEEWAAYYCHCVRVFWETAMVNERQREEAMMWAELCFLHAALAMARVRARTVEVEREPDLPGDDR